MLMMISQIGRFNCDVTLRLKAIRLTTEINGMQKLNATSAVPIFVERTTSAFSRTAFGCSATLSRMRWWV